MSTIKATVDGTEYSPVESISTGGKTVDLEAELDLENKEITIAENGDTEVTPSEGKDGIGSVVVHTNVESSGEFLGGMRYDAVNASGKPTEVTFKGMPNLMYQFYNNAEASTIQKINLSDDVKTIPNAFMRNKDLRQINLPNSITKIDTWAFGNNSNLVVNALPSALITLGEIAFGTETGIGATVNITTLPSGLVTIDNKAFNRCKGGLISHIPASVAKIGNYAFGSSQSSERMTADAIYFDGTPTTISATAFEGNTWITDIYVPWAENAVANAPWGATNATIHYNHVG